MLLNKTNAHTHTQTLCHTRNSPDQIHTQTHTRNVWVFVAKQICSPPQSELGTVRHAFANSPALLLYSHIIGFSPNSSIHTHTWSSMLFLSYSLQHKMLLHYDGKCIRHNFPIDLVHFSNCHEFPPPSCYLSLSRMCFMIVFLGKDFHKNNNNDTNIVILTILKQPRKCSTICDQTDEILHLSTRRDFSKL